MANLCLLSFVFLVTHHVYASDVLTTVDAMLKQDVIDEQFTDFCNPVTDKYLYDVCKLDDLKLPTVPVIKSASNAINILCARPQRHAESAVALLFDGQAAIDYLNKPTEKIEIGRNGGRNVSVSKFVKIFSRNKMHGLFTKWPEKNEVSLDDIVKQLGSLGSTAESDLKAGKASLDCIRSAMELAKTVLAQHEISSLQKAEKTTSVQDHMKHTHFYIPHELTDPKRKVFEKFIQWKLQSGSEHEKTYYQRFTDKGKKATPDGEQKFIASLISKRTRMFVGKLDLTLLRKEHSDITIWLPWHYIGNDDWEQHTEKVKGGPSNRTVLYELWKEWVDIQSKLRNGKYHEDYNLYQMKTNAAEFPFEYFSIENYLSYDEMQLAALMIVAGPTTFYSNCRDKYANRKYGEGEFVKNGYIVGIVGPRLELPGVMDFSLLFPSEEEKDKKLRAIVYGEQYEKGLSQSADGYIMVEWKKGNDEKAMPRALRKRAFIPWANGNKAEPADEDVIMVPIHRELFKERLKITFGAYLDFVHETMQKEADKEKRAYVIVLPIGAGAWALGFEVNKYIFEVIESLLEEREYAPSIGTVHLTGDPRVWQTVNVTKVNGVDISKEVISGPTATETKKKNEQGELVDFKIDEKKTVRFFAYPWDSNALPGNEFWFPVSTNWHGVGDKKTAKDKLDGLVGDDNGVLQWSGDPAAACCSDIIFTENWIHNTDLSGADGKKPDWGWLQQPAAEARETRRLQTKQENAEEEEIKIDRDLLTSGLSSYSFYSVVLLTVILATAMFIVSFFCVVV